MTTPETTIPPMRADRLGESLIRLVLPTSADLVAHSGLSPQQVKDDLQDLGAQGFVRMAVIGCSREPVPVWWLSHAGVSRYARSEQERLSRSPERIAKLFHYDLPRLEAVSDLVRLSSTYGRSLAALHFYDDEVPAIAVADYRLPLPDDDPTVPENGRAYTVFVWASLAHSERALYHRLEALPEAFKARLLDLPCHFSPSRVCIVGDDAWAASRALYLAAHALRGWIEPRNLTAWYRREGRWNFAPASQFVPDILPPSYSLAPNLFRLLPVLGELVVDPPTQSPKGNLDRRISRSPWFGRAGPGLFELLTLVGQYPVASVDHYTAWLREPGNSLRIQQRLDRLIELRLVRVVTEVGCASDGNLRGDGRRDWYKSVPMAISERGQRKRRYALTWTGLNLFCRLHLGDTDYLWTATKLSEVESGLWKITHQDMVYDFLAQCAEMGCEIAPDWRVVITLGDGGWIRPDGAVLASTDLWGRTWHYFEVELSKRTPKAIGARWPRYASPLRQDGCPLLVVAYNATAEFNSHAVGRSHGLRMLTTTVGRLAESGVFGEGVWSHYGDPVTLRA